MVAFTLIIAGRTPGVYRSLASAPRKPFSMTTAPRVHAMEHGVGRPAPADHQRASGARRDPVHQVG